jgi:hypothetical protein
MAGDGKGGLLTVLRSLSLASLLVLGSLLVAVSAPAQDAPAAKEALTEDAADDVVLYVAPNLGVPPQSGNGLGSTETVDLRSVTIGGETDKEFLITLVAKALPDENGPRPMRLIHFQFEDVRYRIGLGFQRGGSANQGVLQAWDEGANRFRSVSPLETQVQASAGAVTFTLPRELVINSKHVPVRFGDTLQNVSAVAQQSVATLNWLPSGDPTGGAYYYDRLPNEGVGVPFTFSKGRIGSGAVALLSDDPIRVSNGEATTIVYRVDLLNRGTERTAYQLETADVPALWSVRVPGLLTVEPGDFLTFPVILSIPFTHNHGQTATFELRAQSVASRDDWSVVRLGVHWTTTPQPAGHHPEMWLHSSPASVNGFFDVLEPVAAFRSAWFNPLEEDPEPDADDAPVPAFFNNELARFFFSPDHPIPGGNEWTTEWFLPLSPALLIGLDFDLERQGVLDNLRVKHGMPANSAQIMAQLLYCDPDRIQGPGNCTSGGGGGGSRWSVIADGRSETRKADRDEVVGYRIPLDVKSEADFLPYKRGANLALRLVLVTDVPANTLLVEPRPQLVVKGAVLTLPLIEYHDPIDKALEALGTLELKSLVPVEKKVNPGRTTLFQFSLLNKGEHADEVQLELYGENKDWARLVGDSRIALPAKGERSLELAVTVPDREVHGAYARLILVAQSLKDPAVVSTLQVRATVVQNEDIPDEAPTAAQKENSRLPGFEAALLGLALLGAAVATRRRT